MMIKIEKQDNAYKYEMDFHGNDGFYRKPMAVVKVTLDDDEWYYEVVDGVLFYLDPPIENNQGEIINRGIHHSPIWSITNTKDVVNKAMDYYVRKIKDRARYFRKWNDINERHLSYFNTLKEQLNR